MKKRFILFYIFIFLITGLPGCSQNGSPSLNDPVLTQTENKTSDLTYSHSLDLEYAKCFSADYYEEGYVHLKTDHADYLVVPEGMDIPESVSSSWIILKRPFCNVYLVASASMDMISSIGALDSIAFSGKKAEDWAVPEAADAMNSGDLVYAGKYSKPDYELIVTGDCDLVIENTMIFHSPEVIEQFEKFNIPVIIEYSNYEDHPLGRVEWIKFYGALFGLEEEADLIYEQQKKMIMSISDSEKTDLTVAYFYITSNNLFQVRRSSDYVPKMIELAGGRYVFENLGSAEDNRSTLNMQAEEFYNGAKDADILIYNSAIDGSVTCLEDLYSKCELLRDFKASAEGRVYCTSSDIYQQPLSTGYLIEDFHDIITGDDDDLKYVFKLE